MDAAAQALPAVELPLAPEQNPPGDIPDNQVFVDFHSAAGFALQVPEGWARQDVSNATTFTNNYDGVAVTQSAAPTPPTVASTQETLVPQLLAEARAVTVDAVEEVALPAGVAIRITYHSNSDPNPVTNKAIRLENERFYFWKDGVLVGLDLWAPAGADNVDQWQFMSESFRWE